MSLSLIAVFIPILLVGALLGCLFREFAITLSVAILVSLAVSLTTTPMMCAYFIPDRPVTRGRLYRWSERGFDRLLAGYARTLDWALRHALAVVLILAGVLALNAYLYLVIPKGFFPQQDTGRLTGRIQADQATSFQLMRGKLRQFVDIVREDPAVDAVVGFTGGGQTNGGAGFGSPNTPPQRGASAAHVNGRAP